MKLQLFQITIIINFIIFNIALGDDLIKLSNRQIWKVQECILEQGFYIVKPCFRETPCSKKYSKEEYACEASFACGIEHADYLIKTSGGSIKNLASGTIKVPINMGSKENEYAILFYENPKENNLKILDRLIKEDRAIKAVFSIEERNQQYNLNFYNRPGKLAKGGLPPKEQVKNLVLGKISNCPE